MVRRWLEDRAGKVVHCGVGWARPQLAGKAAAGRPGKAMGGRVGGPTIVCRETGRNNWGTKQTSQPRTPAQRNKASNL